MEQATIPMTWDDPLCVEIDQDAADAYALVAAWYDRWYAGHWQPRPTPQEVATARELVQSHGSDRVRRALPLLISLLKERWPNAKRWGASLAYWPVALARTRPPAQFRKPAEKTTAPKPPAVDTTQEPAKPAGPSPEELAAYWRTLTADEQERYKAATLARVPSYSRTPGLLLASSRQAAWDRRAADAPSTLPPAESPGCPLTDPTSLLCKACRCPARQWFPIAFKRPSNARPSNLVACP